MRHAMLSDMTEKVRLAREKASDPEIAAALELLCGDTLRLMKDSEDRAHGTPRQAIDHFGSGPDGEIVFKTVYETRSE